MEEKRLIDRKERLIQQEKNKKEEEEEDITSNEKWKEFGKTDIPCFFDKKCAYLS